MFYFKQLVGGANAFPYTLGQQFPSGGAVGWKHFEGTSKEDGSQVSIFRVSGTPSDHKLQAARNGVKRLKSVRHPNVLAFKFTHEIEEKGETIIYLVTEPVKPLHYVLESLDIDQDARKEYVAMGMYQVAKAVAFLNNDCKMIHGSLGLEAIAVTAQLDWKLHAFDFLTEVSGAENYDAPLKYAPKLIPQSHQAAELAKEEWASISQGPPWAVDAWGLGCLMQETFSGKPLHRTEELRNLDHIPKPVSQDYQRLLASAPTRRLNPSKLAESSVLKNKLVQLIQFLENLAVKDSAEKDAFFRKLPSAIPSLPVPVAQKKLLPMLSNALEFGGAPAVALAAMLQIGKTLEAEEFQKCVIPAVSKLFSSSDRAMRRSLLENIEVYGQHMDQATVEGQIYPQVERGFSDSNAYLRELTLKSMLVLAPKLSQKTIQQSLLKHLSKLQQDEEAPIRANTTILLGNLAQYLSEAKNKQMLLNAFFRPLKDPFPPARIAGLKAILATKERHSPSEAATRILPNVSPLTMDPVSEARQSALLVITEFAKILREHCVHLDEKAASEGQEKDSSPAGGWTASLGGSLGWAISSANSLRASPGENPAQPRTGLREDNTENPVRPAIVTNAGMSQPGRAPSNDGWGDMDDLDDELSQGMANTSLEESKPATTKPYSAISSRTASASLSTQGMSRNTSGTDLKDWPDNDDDGWTEDSRSSSLMSTKEPTDEAPPPARRPPAARRAAAPRTSRPGRGTKSMKLGAQKIQPKLDVSDF